MTLPGVQQQSAGMARIARAVVPGYPQLVTPRGNRRQPAFFCNDDYRVSIDWMAEWCGRCGVAVWAYGLPPNPVHGIVVPESADGLRRAIGAAQRRYAWSSAVAHACAVSREVIRGLRPLRRVEGPQRPERREPRGSMGVSPVNGPTI